MIKSLKYDVTFSKTSRILSADLFFKTGLTAITGPNETGKSMMVEVIRWCLFGTDALRGSADDYTSLNATLTFEVRGRAYRIVRTLRGGRLFLGEELQAVGTRPINAKVIEILGFDLQVFDISCAANQGDIEKLASMRPADRKRMVDRVIGSDKIEELSTWCGTEATMIGREIAALERNLVDPEPPVCPETYMPSEHWRQALETLREKQRQLHELYGWLRTKPAEPIKPVRPEHGLDMWQLTEAEKLFQLHVYDFNRVIVADEWMAHDLWRERVQFEKSHPRTVFTQREISARKALEIYERDIERLRRAPVVTCPCGKRFRETDEAIGDLEFLIKELGHVPQMNEEVERARLNDWDNPYTRRDWDRVRNAVEVREPVVSRMALARAREPDAIRADDLVTALRRLGVRLNGLEAVRAAIGTLTIYEAQNAAYEAQNAAYAAWQEKAAQVTTNVEALEKAVEPLRQLEGHLAASLAYEASLARYEEQKAIYDTRVVELDSLRADRTSWVEGKAGFNSLRETIKSYLVPSLSKVASGLLSQMTSGARNTVVVDEEFEVTVDGQPIGTLSGSGKACANLALRIGLGQVLTNNVLSVFIGDEIDASMDEERARNIQTSLGMLTGRISQIFIVTHKTTQADHVIELRSSSGG